MRSARNPDWQKTHPRKIAGEPRLSEAIPLRPQSRISGNDAKFLKTPFFENFGSRLDWGDSAPAFRGLVNASAFPISYSREIALRLRPILANWNTALLNGVRFSRTIFSLAPSGGLEMIIESVLVRRPGLENHEQGYDMANQNIAFHQPADTGILNIPTPVARGADPLGKVWCARTRA